MTTEIISIGDELLNGDTINTNASWLGAFMTENGFEVKKVTTISDGLAVIKQTITNAMANADIVLCTGGLGPTHDDMTKKAVADLFDMKMRTDKEVLNFVQDYFKKRNIPFSKSNFGQAEVPEKSEVLFNNMGTAPGLWLDIEGKYLVIMPGVPFEMRFIMNHRVAPKMREKFGLQTHFHSRYIKTSGIGESTLSDEILGKLDKYFENGTKLAFLPSVGGVMLRIDGQGKNLTEAKKNIEPLVKYIYKKAGDYIIGEGKEATLSETVGKLLRNKKKTISTAESCTGGLIASLLTDIPGSSDYFMGSITAYHNQIKEKTLKVDKNDLIKYGAVSKQVALQMAKNVAEVLKTDIGISTTGIAGPDGGSEEKPVGTVWIGFWSKEKHYAIKTTFSRSRIINKQRTANTAFDLVRRELMDIEHLPYNLEKQLP